MKHKSLLFVSPGGTSVKVLRIKIVSIFIAIVLVVLGFSAYFIPSEKFRLNDAEVEQKQQLSVLNDVLNRRMASALGKLGHLKRQILDLDVKKTRVAELMGAKPAPRKSLWTFSNNAAAYSRMSPEVLLEQAERLESRFIASSAGFSVDSGNPFENIPVCKPVPEGAIVTREFGKAIDPFTGRPSVHRGIDFAAPAGTPVIATATGTVIRVEKDAEWGNRIMIAHANGLCTVYAHLGAAQTTKGRGVKRGEVIGEIGSSGLATGPHVHYEILRNGVAVDPETFFFPGKK
jgi:murein DD-endopeptidase MepM/ murein hydrolase activator NlpD